MLCFSNLESFFAFINIGFHCDTLYHPGFDLKLEPKKSPIYKCAYAVLTCESIAETYFVQFLFRPVPFYRFYVISFVLALFQFIFTSYKHLFYSNLDYFSC